MRLLYLQSHLGLLLYLSLSGPALAPPSPLPLRLAGGPGRCAGRVEVLYLHRWGTLCGHTWGLAEAQVVCRQVGCGPALSAPGGAHFGQGEGPVWLDRVTCTGTEGHLGECQVGPWGEASCEHGADVGVVCAGAEAASQLQVRLANGSSACAGRVELFREHKWGTVCDDTWDLQDAQVICRQLGCGHALAAPGHAHFGRGADPIWLDGAHCTGREQELAQCQLHTWGEHDCNHGEDAGVVCTGPTPLQVRLRDGPGPCAGQVQVLHNHTWMGVCGRTWSLLEAEVVCKELGCGPALSAPVGAHLAPGAALEGLTCRGSEMLLLECLREGAGPGTCHSGGAARVACEELEDLLGSCSVLEGLLGVGGGLCGALLGLYLWAKCAGRGRRFTDKPLLQMPEEAGTSPEP
ncbi:soluble scavenger receptor cysteine-rich domain-containing protein SSC5D-like [Manacus candei]|uniref:soluble scavenger receptor cysteine-rich domain-containing protein SSC5D-like n=1 Tax=Manacus candei TaxID=415023 RepID=UPI0022263241|nr:soluble scavenger receptor cysteine-rich domain-containing protein SSC5D-like [Manacus candei]